MSPTTMTNLTFFIAPPSQRHVLDALVDLSNSGVVSDFAWIEAPENPAAAPDSLDPKVLWVTQGRITPSTWTRLVHNTTLRRLRMVLLVPIGGGVEGSSANIGLLEQYYQYRQTPAHVDVRRTRLFIPYGVHSAIPAAGIAAWYDVMLSPEDTKDPGFDAVPWWSDIPRMSGAIAVGVAVQGGVISGTDSAPNDTMDPDSDVRINVVRSFVRMVDANESERKLRSSTLSFRDFFPPPISAQGGLAVQPFPDPLLATSTTAENWARANASQVLTPRIPMPVQEVREIGAWQALKAFFSFLWKAILGAPEHWVRSMITRTKAWGARTVANVVFGADSSIKVVLSGIDSDGRPANWRRIAQAAQSTRVRLPEGGVAANQPSNRDLSSLWTDMVNGARALLDASGQDRLQLRSGSGYVPNREDVLPTDPSTSSIVFPQTFGPILAGTTLEPWDVLEAQQVRTQLTQMMNEGGPRAAEAAGIVAGIDQWMAQNSRRFVPALGHHLANWMAITLSDIKANVERYESLVNPALEAQHKAKQKKLGRVMRFLLLLFLLVVVALVVVGVIGLLGWGAVAIIAAVSTLVWLIMSFIAYLRGQREVFRALAAIKAGQDQLEPLERNIAAGLADFEAQALAYEQYQVWARILRGFLRNPLGTVEEFEAPHIHESVLPEAITREVFTASDQSIGEAAAHLRANLFTIGWLGEAWQAALAAMPALLNPDTRIQYQSGGINLLTQTGAPGTALGQWAQAVENYGLHSEFGNTLWNTCLQRLTQQGGPTLELVSQVSGMPLEAFRGALRNPARMQVVAQIVMPVALRDGKQMVTAEHWYHEQRSGLSATMILVQSSQEMDSKDFTFGNVAPALDVALTDDSRPIELPRRRTTGKRLY